MNTTPLSLLLLAALLPAPSTAASLVRSAPLHCLAQVRAWPSSLDEERALYLCGGAPTSQGPAACFSSARAWPSSLSDERAVALCRGALEAESPLACLAAARPWPYSLSEPKAIALCRAARSAAEPLACFAEARGPLGDDGAIELCGSAGPRYVR